MEKKERLLFSLDLENKRKRDLEVSEEDAQKKTCTTVQSNNFPS